MPGYRLHTSKPLRHPTEVYSLVHLSAYSLLGSRRKRTFGTGFVLDAHRELVVTAAHVVSPGGATPVSVTVDLWPVHEPGWASVSALAVGFGDWLIDDVAVLVLDTPPVVSDGYVLAPPAADEPCSDGLLYGYAARQGEVFSQRNDFEALCDGPRVRFTRGSGVSRMSGGPATWRRDVHPKQVAGVYSGLFTFDTGRAAYATALDQPRADSLAALARQALA